MGGEDASGPRGFGILGANTVRILMGTLVTFIAVVLVSLVGFWYQGCPKGGFRCRDGACLPRNMWCDNVTDCLDGEDESAENCLLPPGPSPELIMDLLDSMKKCDLCVCPRWSSLANCEPEPKDNTSMSECKAGSDVLPRPFPSPFVRNPRSERPLTSPIAHVSPHAPPVKKGEVGDFADGKEYILSRSSADRLRAGPPAGPRRRRAHSEGELGHRSPWNFDLRRVMRFKPFRSFSDVTQEYSHSKEDGERVSKPTWGTSNVGTGRKMNNRLRRTGEYATEITTTARKRLSYSVACDSSFVDTGFCDGVAQDKTSARLHISAAGPPGSLLVSHTLPANTDLSSNTDLNKATHADMISSSGMNRVSKTASHVDLKTEKTKQQNKQTIEKNETGLAGKPTHDSVGFDLAGGPCKPRSRLCRPKKRERRYLSSGVPQMGHGHGGGRSNRKPFPKKRLEGGRYNILQRRGQGTAPPPERDLQGQLILNMRRVEHHNETRSAYDVEEVVDPEINDCFCEYSSQLKCLGERITKIPSRIVGNVTWFIVRMSSVQNLEVEVMAQYPSLRIM
ncbi:uncharacterized protein LOC134771809 [Penaeus indicus]|uniref:uncharacterized protein LOC134771809 n=1 Tax=Penaeus indicus TaxID=29960 RepID=UPI00300C5870